MSINFNGTNQSVNLPTFDIGNGFLDKLTLCCWVYPVVPESGVDPRWFAKADGIFESDHTLMMGQTDSGKDLRVRLKTGSTTTTMVLTSDPITFNQWDHYAFTYDGSNMNMYINGANVYSIAKTGMIPTNSMQCNIGVGHGPVGHFKGRLEDMRIYHRALSANELSILARHKGSAPMFSGLVNWWPMQESHTGNVSTVIDRVSGRNGTPVNTPTYLAFNSAVAPQVARRR